MTSSLDRFDPHLRRDIEDVLDALHSERASAHLDYARLANADWGATGRLSGPDAAERHPNDVIHRRDAAQRRIDGAHVALRSFEHFLASVTPSAAAPGSAPPPHCAGSASSRPRSTGSGC
ncbi:hypothetical protein NSI01_17110 [Pimelobacter simplex]|nr:hypothetical protein NSI01_17110 [Pimelobacter simplex]